MEKKQQKSHLKEALYFNGPLFLSPSLPRPISLFSFLFGLYCSSLVFVMPVVQKWGFISYVFWLCCPIWNLAQGSRGVNKDKTMHEAVHKEIKFIPLTEFVEGTRVSEGASE